MTNHSDASAYEKRLDRAVILSAQTGAHNFADLLARLAGASPVDLRTALRRLEATGAITHDRASRLLAEPQGLNLASAHTPADDLPHPHPLDADWRFTPETARLVSEAVRRSAGKSKTIALLGVPTVFRELASEAGPHSVLLERSGSTTATLEKLSPLGAVVRCDVARDRLPELSARVVVADPPWYPEDMRAFAWAASSVAASGATVLFSIPPLLVRPGVARERRNFLDFALLCGLELVSVQTGVLRYSTPTFERNAFAAAGFRGEYPDWRVGDLAEFRASRSPLPPRPRPRVVERWRFERASTTTIAFRDEWPIRTDARLIRIVPGDILPSVSRRDPLRSQVKVWTTGNRVFGCLDPMLASALAHALATGADPISSAATRLGRPISPAERRLTLIATSQLRDIMAAETCDLPAPLRVRAS
jgi:hypothetical protein